MSSDEQDMQTVEKHYRMTLDFRVFIGEVIEVVTTNVDDEEYARERTQRQRRLLRALLSDEKTLADFMTYLITDLVCPHVDSNLGKVFGVEAEQEMLEPVYSRMGEEDARFFREVSEEGIFWENTKEFEMCFGVEWRGARIMEIKWEREGEPSASERMELYLRRFGKGGEGEA